jgi:hypothetical protein
MRTGDEQMKPLKKQVKVERPKRENVTREEALKRMKSFPKRREKFIAALKLERAETIEAIRDGLESVRQGKTMSLDQFDRKMRKKMSAPSKQ